MSEFGLPKFFADLSSWYAIEALAVGHALGLCFALTQGPGTVAEIADRAGADERSTATWLCAMTAAGYAAHDGGVFEVDSDQRPFLIGAIPGVDTMALLDFVLAMGARVPAVIEVLRTGEDPAPDLFGRELGDAVGRVNAPLYAESLVADWLAGDAELTSQLSTGVEVVDLGCGDGTATRLMAEAFPNSKFIGVDRDPAALNRSRDTAPANVSFRGTLPDTFDALTILDTFHHFSDPGALLAEIRVGLPPGGVLVIAESAYIGDVDADASSPFGTIGLACALIYCDVEGRRRGAPQPIAPQDGGVGLRRALSEAGFHNVATHDGVGGFRVYFARQ
jgi:SAM-dependent methyltransferase